MTARQRHSVKALWPVDEVQPGGAPSWTIGAPCKYDLELWFSDDPDGIAAAKATCTAVCPLARRIACMDYAFDNGIEYGVFGGVGREERVEKDCATCGQSKLLSEFPRHKETIDGFKGACKDCARATGSKRHQCLAARKTRRLVLADANERRTAETNERIAKYQELWWDQRLPRSEVMKRLGIGSEKTAQRYESTIREQQGVAA